MKILSVRKDEALRYMGFGDNKPDENFMKLVFEVEQELLKVVSPKYTYKLLEILNIDLNEGRVTFKNCNLYFEGVDIAKHLEGCNRAVVMACTASAGVDKLIRVYNVTDMTKAVICDSLASAVVEQICDQAQKEICDKIKGYTTWRFSCGYGDFPLKTQKAITDLLATAKTIGVSPLESCLLTPVKSVTAVFGVSDKKIEKKRAGCEKCNMYETCIYRKRGGRCEI